MTPGVRASAAILKIAFWRLHQACGTPGVIGLVLWALAGLTLAQAWHDEQRTEVAVRSTQAVLPAAHAASPSHGDSASTRMQLPSVGEVPLLLTRLQRTAVEHSLGWPRADYRLTAPTDASPASLEVKCTLEAPYPNIRRFITALLQDTPALTLRDFSLSRPSADAGNVQAKLTLVIFLAAGGAGEHP